MDTSDLEEILKAGQRAKDLIHQILAFSRKTEPALVPTDVVGLLNEVYQLINTTFPSAIEIKMDLKIDKAMVIADPSRLHQVIMNLCTNARQAMLATGGQLKLSLDCSRLSEQVSGSIGLTDASEYVVLEVSDSGSGIPENLLDRIFEPFFTTKQDSDGTGLGLSVVHGLVTEMGGTINVYSEPEVGTTFTVYLPFTDITESPNVSTTARTTGGQERILVIDDEPAIADMIKRTLDSIGYQVTVFTDPRSALAMLTDRHSDFDLVITDMSMPEVRGDVVASEISLINRDLPVIVCTGYDESLTAERRNELGIRDVLIKPASREELCQSIRNVLGH